MESSRLFLTSLIMASVFFLTHVQYALAQTLDPESAACIECHSGYFTDGTVTHPDGSSHAIGMDYASRAATDPGLTPAPSLDKSLRLPGGRVGCGTCHVPYSEADHERLSAERARIPEIPDPMLNIDNKGSALCLACHRK